jgi:Asp/Glu/hydantoin racemase
MRAERVPRLVVINPNRSSWMTQCVGGALARNVNASQVLVTATDGPEVIDSVASFGQAGMTVRNEARRCLAKHGPADAMVIACFGDPGLEALRADPLMPPVFGLAHSAMRQAVERQQRFAVLTCGPDWKPLLTQRAHAFGMADGLVGVWALPVNGAVFAHDPAAWWPAILQNAQTAADEGATSLILGGAVFSGLTAPPAPAGTHWVDAIEACSSDVNKAFGQRTNRH